MSRALRCIATAFVACLVLPGAWEVVRAQMTGVLLHARMESVAEISSPDTVTEKVGNWQTGGGVWVGGTAAVEFEPGASGLAARLNGTSWTNVENLVFAPRNFDFADRAMDGGAIDFRLKFNVDPHVYTGNKFILRTGRTSMGSATLEIYGSDPYLAFTFLNAENPSNRLLVYSLTSTDWKSWKLGEWHRVTITWKKNAGTGVDELHMFIDGRNAGCSTCNDSSGFLPAEGSWEGLYVGNNGTLAIDFSIDELQSFGASGPVWQMPPVPPKSLRFGKVP